MATTRITPTQSISLKQFSVSLLPSSKVNNLSFKHYYKYNNNDNSRKKSLVGPLCATHSADVVIVGAGIIGLTIARQFLHHSNLSVAIVDAAVPCSGATGAGQGYIWMAHKTPGSAVYDLGMRSQNLWQSFADSIQEEGVDPSQALGWKKSGSLMIGTTEAELNQLKTRVQQFSDAGLKAQFLSDSDLAIQEPELALGPECGAAFLPDDSQIDAYRTVSFIEKGNRLFASQGRYTEIYHDPAVALLRSNAQGNIEGIRTNKNTLYGRKAIIIAAGCWSGSLMHKLLSESDIVVNVPVQPRKGFLLVLENFRSLRLNHGMMEVGYVSHQQLVKSTPGEVDPEGDLSVSMTAAVDAFGNLVLGSSRQFSGFNAELDMPIVNRIWKRAQDFFPALRELSLENLSDNMNVRIGLRPYMPDGKPVIGPVPNMSNVFLATGHEGSGLGLALGTAELVTDMVLDNPLQVDHKPFAVEGRCC